MMQQYTPRYDNIRHNHLIMRFLQKVTCTFALQINTTGRQMI